MTKIKRICEDCNTIFSPDDPFNIICPNCHSKKVKIHLESIQKPQNEKIVETGKCTVCKENLIKIITSDKIRYDSHNKPEKYVSTEILSDVSAVFQGQNVIWICKKCDSIIGFSSVGVVDSEKFKDSGVMHMLSFLVAENIYQSTRR